MRLSSEVRIRNKHGPEKLTEKLSKKADKFQKSAVHQKGLILVEIQRDCLELYDMN